MPRKEGKGGNNNQQLPNKKTISLFKFKYRVLVLLLP